MNLKISGYNSFDRYQILQSGFNCYEKLRSKVDNGSRPFYRNRHFEKRKRKYEKLEKKTSWFTKKASGTRGPPSPSPFSSVFFVPSTPGSVLLSMLRKTEEQHQISSTSRIKFVETSGRKFIDQLQIKDPYGENCRPQDDCFVCQNTIKQTNCKTSNVGYSVVCRTCKERGTQKSYEGETCRNAHLRGKEHLRDLSKQSEKSALFLTHFARSQR